MKSRIVKDDDAARFNFLQKTALKPKFKQNTVCRTVIFHRCNPIALTNPGNDIGSLKLLSADFCNDFLTAQRICKLAVQILINTTFVNVYKAFRRYCFQQIDKLKSRTNVYFFIQSGFFYALFSNALRLFVSRTISLRTLPLFHIDMRQDALQYT